MYIYSITLICRVFNTTGVEYHHSTAYLVSLHGFVIVNGVMKEDEGDNGENMVTV